MSPGRVYFPPRCLSVVAAGDVDWTAGTTNRANGRTRVRSSRTTGRPECRGTEAARASVVCGPVRCGYWRGGHVTSGPAALRAATSRGSCSPGGRTSPSWHSGGGSHCTQSIGDGPGSLQR